MNVCEVYTHFNNENPSNVQFSVCYINKLTQTESCVKYVHIQLQLHYGSFKTIKMIFES